MAAPHVTGAIALLLEKRPGLTCDQVRQILTRSARHDGFVPTVPDNLWGFGKLDIAAALQSLAVARFPAISEPKVAGTKVSWKTDIPTTAAVRISTNQRQLQLGKNQTSRADLSFKTEHAIDLADLGAGSYFLEILAFSQDNWRSLEDNGGNLFNVHV